MKKLLTFLFFIIPISLFADTITIVSDPWYPYTGDLKEKGFLIDIATAVFKKHGHEVVYKVIPWNRAVIDSKSGRYNAVAGAYKGDAPGFIFPDNEQGIGQDSIFVKKSSSWQYKNIKSFDEITIGVINGYSYGDEVDEYIEKNRTSGRIKVLSSEKALTSLIKMTEAGRIDAFLESKIVALHKIKEMHYSDKIYLIANLPAPQNVYIAFSPALENSKEYAEILSKGMIELRESGELSKIMTKYGLTDWK